MINRVSRRVALVGVAVLGFCSGAARPVAACDQWLAPAQMVVIQTNGPRVGFTVKQVGTAIHGYASYQTTQRTIVGNYSGSIVGDVFQARVLWTYSGVSAIGRYSGRIKPLAGVSDPKGYIFEGTTYDEYRESPDLQYWNAYHFTCQPAAIPAPPPPVKIIESSARDSATAVVSGARIETATNAYADSIAAQTTTATGAAADVARLYRVPPPAPSIDTASLAERGAVLAGQITLAGELRARAPDESARRGFDIGMGAAEGNTLPGPGKQRIHDSLPQSEQIGFESALAFSLDWNRNTALALQGAVIADASPDVAAARMTDPEPLYWLGFDIATGIFGDPALGARGNTATGPGSMGIRNALGVLAQKGFDASVTFHLGRQYVP